MALYEEELKPYSIHSLLWIPPSRWSLKLCSRPHLIESFHWWDAIKHNSFPTISRFSLFLFQCWFPPGCCYPSFRAWRKATVTQLIGLTSNGKLLSILELEDWLAASVPWYMYLQLTRMMQTIHLDAILHEPLTGLEKKSYFGLNILQRKQQQYCTPF